MDEVGSYVSWGAHESLVLPADARAADRPFPPPRTYASACTSQASGYSCCVMLGRNGNGWRTGPQGENGSIEAQVGSQAARYSASKCNQQTSLTNTTLHEHGGQIGLVAASGLVCAPCASCSHSLYRHMCFLQPASCAGASSPTCLLAWPPALLIAGTPELTKQLLQVCVK